MRYPTELDRAWTAGLIDGEGCIHIDRHRARKSKAGIDYALRVTVGMTDEKTIQHLQELWGGALWKHKNLPPRKPTWFWGLNRQQAATFLQSIYPFLITKTQEAEIALDAEQNWRRRPEGGRNSLPHETLALREGYYLALQEAKR